mmetsp:Transcript_22779/g.58377  ORF Transcript_22779/g.58377 Transcript_22779/m.58377 type:complete len:92 (-) Transcript_22779:295-570(-)
MGQWVRTWAVARHCAKATPELRAVAVSSSGAVGGGSQQAAIEHVTSASFEECGEYTERLYSLLNGKAFAKSKAASTSSESSSMSARSNLII